jgi:long-chain acyl-CoA synthetase
VLAADREALPVGPTGKVLKRRLREEHRDLLSRPPSPEAAVLRPAHLPAE